MTVDITEIRPGVHTAIIGRSGKQAPCCEAGHPDPQAAARHAQRLIRVMQRHEAREHSGT